MTFEEDDFPPTFFGGDPWSEICFVFAIRHGKNKDYAKEYYRRNPGKRKIVPRKPENNRAKAKRYYARHRAAILAKHRARRAARKAAT